MRKRSSYRPRAVITNPLTLIQAPTKADKDRVMGRFLSALDAIANGSHPGVEEWRDLSDSINTVETLALHFRKLVLAEVMPPVNRAIEDMVHASRRFKAGQGLRFDAAGLQALREVVDIYGQCLDGFTAHEMAQAQAETQRRVNQLLHDKNRRADVVEL